MATDSFTIVNLPKLADYTAQNPTSFRLANKFRDLRLHALKANPDAFASTYEVEAARDIGHTLERLSNPEADHFIAVASVINPWSASTGEKFFGDLFASEWIGMIVLIGPLDENSASGISAKRDPLAGDHKAWSEKEVTHSAVATFRYHLNGVFVDPQSRRAGIGHALIEAAINKASIAARGRSAALGCTILVDSGNTTAKALYERHGFCVIGEETYAQLTTSGDVQKAERRVALRMEMQRM